MISSNAFPSSVSVLVGLALVSVSCGDSAVEPTDEAMLPDTTAEAVMNHLEQEDYQKSWELWPGLEEMYEGSEPHGMLLTTRLNPTAFAALNSKSGSMPDGAIIVKENYTPEGVFDATTLMYKREGYNPEHKDWFWAKVGADGAVQAEGKVAGCIACHSGGRDNDYVLTGSLR